MAFMLTCLGWSSAFSTELSQVEFQLDAPSGVGKEGGKENKRKQMRFLDSATCSGCELTKRNEERGHNFFVQEFLNAGCFLSDWLSCAEISQFSLMMVFPSPFSTFEGRYSVYLVS